MNSSAIDDGVRDDHGMHAFHEAAHAVAARLLGLEITRISPETGVRVRHRRDRDGFERNAMVALAGIAAERRVNPDGWRGPARMDVRNAIRSAALACRFDEYAPSEEWRDAKVLLAALCGRTDSLLAEHWGAVERVAAGLLGHRELEGPVLDAVISGEPLR